MHNDHYTKLAEYEPFKVYEAWARGNEELFKKHFTFGGYYLASLKYLARIESKDDPVKNLEKVRVYVQQMINILKDNQADAPPPEPIEWHTHEEQPEKGRWIEWDGQKYVADGYTGKKQATLFREANGNYTAYLWHVGYESPIKGYWGWEEMKHWGKWRYIDAPS